MLKLDGVDVGEDAFLWRGLEPCSALQSHPSAAAAGELPVSMVVDRAPVPALRHALTSLSAVRCRSMRRCHIGLARNSSAQDGPPADVGKLKPLLNLLCRLMSLHPQSKRSPH